MAETSTLKLALQHHQAGDLVNAERLYRQVLESEPNRPNALHLLGVLLHQKNQHQEASEYIRRAIAIRGDQPHYHNNLGEAYRALHQLEEAKRCYERALRLKPDYHVACNNLGQICQLLGLVDQAKQHLEKAIELKPDYADAWDNLGKLLQSRGQANKALDCYRRALQANPQYAPAHNNLGNILSDLGKFQEAFDSYQEALRYDPQCGGAQANLANLMRKQGRVDEAAEAYYKAAEAHPATYQFYGNALRCEQYRVGVTAESLAAKHARFADRYAKPLKGWSKHENDPDPDRPLRLGFLSDHFHRHPVTYLSVQILEHLDRTQTELFFYYSDQRSDDMTNRLRRLGQWRELPSATDEVMARQIRDDQVDILFNMAGLACILVFARKPAPLQVAWLGYVGTTGIDAIDYVLGDPYHTPESHEPFYRERILRLPRCYACYDLPEGTPDVPPLPALTRSMITFGGSHNPTKLSRPTLETWSSILQRVPKSRLLLRYLGLNEPEVRARYFDVFESCGIDPKRIGLAGSVGRSELFDWYRNIDITLDPFPYSGGMTTCDALWMGLPVITKVGDTFAGRHSFSYLSNVGMQELVATDVEDYIEKAVALAGDHDKLMQLRATMRDRVRTHLCDGHRTANELLDALRHAWRAWCASATQRK